MDSSRGQLSSWHQQRQPDRQQEQGQHSHAQHLGVQPPYSSQATPRGPSQLSPPYQVPSHVYSSHSASQLPASSMSVGGRNQSIAEVQGSWQRQQQQIRGEQMRRQPASDTFHQPNQQQQRQVYTMSRTSDHHQQRQHSISMQSANATLDSSREANFWGPQSHVSPAGSYVQQPQIFSREPASPLPSLAQPFSGASRSNETRSAAHLPLPQWQSSGRVQPQSTSRPLVDVHNQNSSPMAHGRAATYCPAALSTATSRPAPYPPPRSHRLPSASSSASPRLVRDELPLYEPGTFNPDSSNSQAQDNNRSMRRSDSHYRSHHSSVRPSNSIQSGLRLLTVVGESSLPPHAPISVVCPQEEGDRDGGYGGQDDDVVMEEEDPLEVTLNMDLPKSTRSSEGEPSTTVLNVNPSWHCVFVETVQQGRIRCSLRIQFCGSSRRMEHRALVCQLQSLQVIGYQSRQVEMTRRISGKNILNKGGIIAINYNDACYGFTISLSSFSCDRLDCRYYRPDELLPLTRQQNSAFCRRNLKELFNDTSSKDVAVALLPTQELFYVHSVVLENYGYFRALLEEQGDIAPGHARLRRQGSSRSGLGCFMTSLVGIGDVDEDGFAQPLDLHSFPTTLPLQQHQQQPSSQQQQPPVSAADPSASSSSQPPPSTPPARPNRPMISLEVEGVSPNVLRAILHFMYMGHIPTTGNSCFRSSSPTSSACSTAATATRVEKAGSSSSCSVPSSAPTAPEADSIPTPVSILPTVNPFEFAWTDLYDAAVRFQLVGLTRLARLVLVSRLEPELAVQELMTWAYQHENLIPCYVSFIIENVHPDHLTDDKMTRPNARANNRSGADRTGNSGEGGSASMLWDYRERCPKFGEILLMMVQMLDERRPVLATL